jgi:hypothetical protein
LGKSRARAQNEEKNLLESGRAPGDEKHVVIGSKLFGLFYSNITVGKKIQDEPNTYEAPRCQGKNVSIAAEIFSAGAAQGEKYQKS